MIVDKRERLCRVYHRDTSLTPIDVTIEPLARPPVKITIPATVIWHGGMAAMIAAMQRAEQEAEEMLKHLQTQETQQATAPSPNQG